MTTKDIVMKRDQTFCEDCQTGKEKAWASYFLDNGVMVTSGNNQNIVGKTEIEKAMKKIFSLKNIDFTWEPKAYEVSNDGTLAVTRGISRIAFQKDGKDIVQHGNYTTVWKYTNGNWFISWDIGN